MTTLELLMFMIENNNRWDLTSKTLTLASISRMVKWCSHNRCNSHDTTLRLTQVLEDWMERHLGISSTLKIRSLQRPIEAQIKPLHSSLRNYRHGKTCLLSSNSNLPNNKYHLKQTPCQIIWLKKKSNTRCNNWKCATIFITSNYKGIIRRRTNDIKVDPYFLGKRS